MGQIASIVWKGGSQDKQNYHCMVAGTELQKHATDHEMSNQQSEKPGLPNTNLNRLENWWLPTTSQLHFFALHNVYLEPF